MHERDYPPLSHVFLAVAGGEKKVQFCGNTVAELSKRFTTSTNIGSCHGFSLGFGLVWNAKPRVQSVVKYIHRSNNRFGIAWQGAGKASA